MILNSLDSFLILVFGFLIGIVVTFEFIFNKLITRAWSAFNRLLSRLRSKLRSLITVNSVDLMLYGGWTVMLTAVWVGDVPLSWKLAGSAVWLIILGLYQFISRSEEE